MEKSKEITNGDSGGRKNDGDVVTMVETMMMVAKNKIIVYGGGKENSGHNGRSGDRSKK